MQYGRLLAILVLVQQQLCGVSSKKLAKTTVVAVASSAQQVKLITASFTGGRETMREYLRRDHSDLDPTG